MPIVPSPREPVQALLARLDDARAATRDAAAARLRLSGPGALEALLDWLPAASADGRRTAVAVLEALPDPRARAGLLRLCADGDDVVALRALEAAGEPSAGGNAAESVTCVGARAAAGAANSARVRQAALESLVRLHRAGAVEALEPLLDVLLDEAEDERLRLAASAVLPDIGARARRPLMARLAKSASAALLLRLGELDPSAARPTARRGLLNALHSLRPGTSPAAAAPASALAGDAASVAAALAGAGTTSGTRDGQRATLRPTKRTVGAHAAAPGDATSADATPLPRSDGDPAARPLARGDVDDALAALARFGPEAVASVAEALRRERVRSDDEAERVAAALAALGPPALPALQRALDALSRAPATPAANVVPAHADDAARAEAKAVLHLALARLDSRLALYDLREMLAARPPRALRRVLAVAASVGDASVAAEIARLVATAPDLRDDCAPAFAAIVTRERLTKRARAFKGLPDSVQAAVSTLWPRGRQRER